MTNFEQFKKDIQTMTADQLAEFMFDPPEFCRCRQCFGRTCKECFCDWLNEEVEEKNDGKLKPCP